MSCYNIEKCYKTAQNIRGSMKRYKLTVQEVNIDSKKCKCYGVCASDGTAFEQLSFSRSEAEQFVNDLNGQAVEYCHFKDAVDDFLALKTTAAFRFTEE